MPPTAPTDEALRHLRSFGLAYPEATTRSPWPGHLDLVVRDKTFAFLSVEGEPLSVTCKLPSSAMDALQQPHCAPAGYGLGRHGWVHAAFPPGAPLPLPLLERWIDESYRAIAPRALLRALDAMGHAPRSP